MSEPQASSPPPAADVPPATATASGLVAGASEPPALSTFSAAEAPLQLREPEASHPPPAAVEGGSGSALPARVGRYEVLEELAHGGMGAVFKVRDPDLGRTLALKVLLHRHQERPDLQRRFLEEAQIGGQLQHPGLVPVHEMGRTQDNRPFFTMKLVKGRTLAELLKERATPAAHLPRLLTIFEQVCQTLAYAHSRGVIHRDLKPANVMVGAFGEVQVMDWGLAKLLGHEPATPLPPGAVGASTLYSARAASENDSATRAGTILGTPAYMPPEQARGQVEHLDERADVFGLGALLCEILTGQPPYVGTREQVIARATQGDLAEARGRLERCGADAELVRLALRCLAFQPLERPAHAGAVAEAITAYRAGVEQRVRQAELARAAAQTKAAEERKRRRLVVVLAVVVLVALVGGGSFWLWQEQKRQALEYEASAALDRATLLQQEGKWADALAQARQAAGLLPAIGDRPDLRQRIDDRIAEIELVQQVARIRTPPTDSSVRLRTRYRADAAYGAAFRKFGIDVDTLDPAEAAKRIAARPALRPVLIAALDDWVLPRKQARPDDPAGWQRLLAVARAADPDPWRDRLRQAVSQGDSAALMKMAEAPDLAAPLSTLQLLAEWLVEVEERQLAIAVLRRVQWQHPGDFWVTFRLGHRLRSRFRTGLQFGTPELEEALRCYATAVALRPDSGLAWFEYGLALLQTDRVENANAAADRARQLLPDHPFPHILLAWCLKRQGDLQGMQREHAQALNLGQQAVQRSPQDEAAWIGLADALVGMGKRAEALQAYLKWAESFPDALGKNLYAGQHLVHFGRYAEALPYLEKALQLNPRLGLAALDLGEAYYELGQLDLGVVWSRKATELPNTDLPAAYNDVAFHLLEKGASLEEADQAIAEALRLSPSLAMAVLTLAEVRREQGRFAESLDAYRRGHELHTKNWASRWPTERWLKEAQRRVELDKQWPALQRAEYQPANAKEYAEFGRLAAYKRLYAASAALYQHAFALDAKLADDLGAGDRYQAARAAIMAGCGHDAENEKLDAAARAGLRRQARAWLSADLAVRRKQLETGKPAERQAVLVALNHWRTHDHLAGLRDAARLAQLPPHEQAACRKLWAEVERLRNQAQGPTK